MNYNKLRSLLEIHEGKRSRPYQCSAGKTTIGIGHNLDDSDLPEEVIQHIFTLDIKGCLVTCDKLFKTWHMLPDMKQVVLANMAFQLGYNRLKGFKKLIAAANAKDWQEASRQMLDSKWARQVPNRANELAEIMRN